MKVNFADAGLSGGRSGERGGVWGHADAVILGLISGSSAALEIIL